MLHQEVGNALRCFSFEEQLVYEPHRFGLLRHHLHLPIRALFKAEKLRVTDADLAVRKALPLSPCDVLGNRSAFLLRQRGHDGKQQFALAVEGEYVFFFKITFTTDLFQLADGDEAVNSVSGKPTDRLGNDEVYLPYVFDTIGKIGNAHKKPAVTGF